MSTRIKFGVNLIDDKIDKMERPLFLTNKFTITDLSQTTNIYDFQLQDHFRNMKNIYTLQCQCVNHKHNKKRCNIVEEPICVKCERPTKILVTYQSLLYHPEIATKKMFQCCTHVHRPPCNLCLNCKTFKPCVITEPFECNVSTDVVCHLNPNVFTKTITYNDTNLHEHIYNIKTPMLYICRVHAHRHHYNPQIECIIQSFECCKDAVFIKDYTGCFTVSVNSTTISKSAATYNTSLRKNLHQDVHYDDEDDEKSSNKRKKFNTVTSKKITIKRKAATTSNEEIANSTAIVSKRRQYDNRKRKMIDQHQNNGNKKMRRNMDGGSGNGMIVVEKYTEFIIYDPRIWREQSYNHFMSFIRAIFSMPEMIVERYKRFESSNFTISNIKKYKSGKVSIIRTAVTGFNTKGIYQTSTISFTIPYHTVIIPAKLYDLLEQQNYDMNLALVIRHPSILTTCMYDCKVVRNPNESEDVIKIPSETSKGFNQDQDGDKNVVNFMLKSIKGYQATSSFRYNLAKLELAAAFLKKITLMAAPRYLFSETTLLYLERYRDLLCERNETFRKFHAYGPKFLNEIFAGYKVDAYEEFQQLLIDTTVNEPFTFITVDDLLLKTDRLPSIIRSCAKGTKYHLHYFLSKISSTDTLLDLKRDLIELYNKYVISSQDLSRDGRKQFTCNYASIDMVNINNYIYINKVLYADYSDFASVTLLNMNESSLFTFVLDLEHNYDQFIKSIPSTSTFDCDDERERCRLVKEQNIYNAERLRESMYGDFINQLNEYDKDEDKQNDLIHHVNLLIEKYMPSL